MNDIMMILRINGYLQHTTKGGKLYLNGHSIHAVALDRSCSFDDIGVEEVELTVEQLAILFADTFFTEGAKNEKDI